MSWLAIWDRGRAVHVAADPAAMGRAGQELGLWLELSVPQSSDRALRLWDGCGGAARALALYLMPDGALRLVHRDVDLASPTGFAGPGDRVTLRYAACARGRRDTLVLRNLDTGATWRGRSGLAVLSKPEDALPRAEGFFCHIDVAAVAAGWVPDPALPGLAAGTRLRTTEGEVPVEALRPGHLMIAPDGMAVPLAWVAGRDRLCLGSAAPVRLRAPFYGLRDDLWLTPETRIQRQGPDIEYIAGTDAVLLSARDLAHGRSAEIDAGHPVRRFYHLLLEEPGRVMVGRCAVDTATLSEVVEADEVVGGNGRKLRQRDRLPSLPLLDQPMARALVAANEPGRRSQF